MLPEIQITHLYRALGSRIKDARQKVGYNQIKFAELLSISRASLVNIEKGRQRPPLHMLYAIAKLSKVELISLLPNEQDFEDKELDKSILKAIKDQSNGKTEIEEALLLFVKQTTNQIK